MNTAFIYSDEYNVSLFGFEKLHKFDGKKFGRAWELFSNGAGNAGINHIIPKSPICDSLLKLVHDQRYLNSLKESKTIAKALEVSLLKLFPSDTLLDKLVKPMKFACQGTVEATRFVLKEGGIAMNFGGGFHHAHSDHGEGFCLFADAAIGIQDARSNGLIAENDEILMIDLDAHRGNGFESIYCRDAKVHHFDIYNFDVYPGPHKVENDYMIPSFKHLSGEGYLDNLNYLEEFLSLHKEAKLAFYNAGTDIVMGDPLGCFNVPYEQVIERDRIVVDQLIRLGIPTVILTSGGYTKESAGLIAELAKIVFEKSSSA